MNKCITTIVFMFLYLPMWGQNTHFPYFSLGIGMLNSKASGSVFNQKVNYIKDEQPLFKFAIGSQITPHWRLEGFYQTRNKIKQNSSFLNIPYSAEAKMQDIGANLFFTINPHGEARIFLGGGLAATNVRPTLTIYNIEQSELFHNDWFTTPMGFVGIEWPDEAGFSVMEITFSYQKTLINKSYSGATFKNITSYGVTLGFRFNTSIFIHKSQ